MNAAAYANRAAARRTPQLHPPRNVAAAQRAREQDVALIVSFVGDTAWSNPTVYCDSATRYDWSFFAGLHAVIVVKGGIDARHAMHEILERSDTIGVGYPVLLDVEAREAAMVVHGKPVNLWQVRRGTELWQQYFEPQT